MTLGFVGGGSCTTAGSHAHPHAYGAERGRDAAIFGNRKKEQSPGIIVNDARILACPGPHVGVGARTSTHAAIQTRLTPGRIHKYINTRTFGRLCLVLIQCASLNLMTAVKQIYYAVTVRSSRQASYLALHDDKLTRELG